VSKIALGIRNSHDICSALPAQVKLFDVARTVGGYGAELRDQCGKSDETRRPE
jgi:hypothetical protein